VQDRELLQETTNRKWYIAYPMTSSQSLIINFAARVAE